MAAFPEKILLATDGSEDAMVATRAAIDLSNGAGSELHVVHAFEFVPPREFMSVALRLKNVSYFSGQGHQLLDEQAEQIGEAGGRIAGAHLRTGSPVDEILSVAEEIGAGLIVVGSRGLGGVKRLLMGSVSEGVVHHAPCPVLVLRDEDGIWPPTDVVVADDCSEHAKEAGELAAAVGGLFGAQGALVQVYPRALEASRREEGPETRMVRDALRHAEVRLRERAEELEGALGSRPRVELVVDEGADGIDGIAMTLLDRARETGGATLLAVGNRGLRAMRRARVGSVSTKVVRAHAGPVLVYAHPRGQAQSSAFGPAGASFAEGARGTRSTASGTPLAAAPEPQKE